MSINLERYLTALHQAESDWRSQRIIDFCQQNGLWPAGPMALRLDPQSGELMARDINQRLQEK